MIRNMVAAIILVNAIAATWLALHPISLPDPRTVRTADEEWRLPNRSRPDAEALVTAIEQEKLWGTNNRLPAEVEKPLTPPNWRITGVVSVGAESYALLDTVGQPIQPVKIGEKLPGGAKVLDMTADRLSIFLNGKKRFLKTYKE